MSSDWRDYLAAAVIAAIAGTVASYITLALTGSRR